MSRRGWGQKVRMGVLFICLLTLAFGGLPLERSAYAAAIFSDNWEDGNATGWTASSGSWSVVIDGTYVYKQSGTGSTAESLTYAGNSSWANYTVSAEMKLNTMNATAASGVIGRYADGNNYYLLRLHATSGLQLYRKSGGTFTLLGSSPYTMDLNTWHTLKLEMNGSTLKGYVDDLATAKITVTDATITQGAVGLRTYGQSASFDSLTVDDGAAVAPIVMLNGDASYMESGTWLNSSLSGYNGSATRYSTTGGSTAKWSQYAPATGNYNVYVWYPTSNNTTNAQYMINSLDGTWTKSVNQTLNPNGWNLIATVSAASGTALTVTLNVISGNTRANAVKVEYTANSAEPQTPPGGNGDTTTVAVFVNQSGYDLDKPKRATVTNVADGTPFYVKKVSDNSTVFTGSVSGQIADFSAWNPSSVAEYYVQSGGQNSYPFAIGKYWMQRVSIGPALRFMDQSRQDTFDVGGNTGYGWRDSHQFSFELNSLVLQYMANPSAYERMPYGISNLSTTEYPDLRVQNEPDIIWLMKFAAERYYDLKVNEGKDLHALIKGQLAYFLYIYPEISQYVSASFYAQIRDFTVAQWSNPNSSLQWYDVGGSSDNNLFATQSVIGTIKGQQPPGYAIVSNLMMYEVAKRDGLPNAQAFWDAAYNNCAWLVNSVNLNDPANTKGQRMSEHVTMEALAYFQEMYGAQAPPGLSAKIAGWSDLMIKRSANLWDLRKYADPQDGTGTLDQWTGGLSAYNEPGSPAGFQASAYAARRVLTDPAVKSRLQQIGIAQIDDVFGRNPFGRHFSYDAPTEIAGVDKGWFTFLNGGYGDLMSVPGVLDGAPKESAYPFSPTADYGYTEGWVAFNTAWNDSLAYAAADDLELKVMNASFSSEISAAAAGSVVGIKLKAPLNFNEAAVETGQVVVTTSAGARSKVTLSEASVNDYYFTATLTVPSGVSYLDVSYGIGLFKKTVRVTVT
ncbi:family 16 glycoside hydrolase [Paenibacillus whitsoniae]|nr:family 16 glycoside hydrolase [Paenibacillus whitsoniae]